MSRFIDTFSQAARPKREHERLLAPRMVVRVKPESANDYEQVLIHDIGGGGVFLKAKRIAPPHSRVDLQFVIPGGREIEAQGEVVHVVLPENVASSKPSGMGIRFIGPTPEIGNQIIAQVAGPKYPQEASANRPIIIVDDDRDTREMLQVVLELEGFDVKLAANGIRLLSSLHVDRPGAILLDVRMSWIDGFALCEGLKRSTEYRDIPIIFISARTEQTDVEQGLALGAVDYFTKPIDTDRLVGRLHEVFSAKDDRASSDAS